MACYVGSLLAIYSDHSHTFTQLHFLPNTPLSSLHQSIHTQADNLILFVMDLLLPKYSL
jgi:hypothetical protein